MIDLCVLGSSRVVHGNGFLYKLSHISISLYIYILSEEEGQNHIRHRDHQKNPPFHREPLLEAEISLWQREFGAGVVLKGVVQCCDSEGKEAKKGAQLETYQGIDFELLLKRPVHRVEGTIIDRSPFSTDPQRQLYLPL